MSSNSLVNSDAAKPSRPDPIGLTSVERRRVYVRRLVSDPVVVRQRSLLKEIAREEKFITVSTNNRTKLHGKPNDEHIARITGQGWFLYGFQSMYNSKMKMDNN